MPSQVREWEKITERLKKNTPEQQKVTGPLVAYLISIGWKLEQIVFGKKEWRVPKVPSEATKREKGRSFSGFPVDIAVFDAVETVGDPAHLLFLIECKQPDEKAGVSQMESYYVGEPHASLGVWVNNADPNAEGVFLYRAKDGSAIMRRRAVRNLPHPNEVISPDVQTLCYRNLMAPTEQLFRKIIADILDKVVAHDTVVTRREDQLDQLCNLLLVKLESDKRGRMSPDDPVFFRQRESPAKTASEIRREFDDLVDVYPETFTTANDKHLRLVDETISYCVEALAGLRLLDMGVESVSLAFQVLRSEALKQGEGQYFTPQTVIEAGVRLLDLQKSDIVIDPACGTGGFLVQAMLEMRRKFPRIRDIDLTKWAQTHLYGIEKDAVGLKLTKAIMQIAGDGSAHCARGDSVRTHKWREEFPHLIAPFKDGRFNVVVTNPPFGKNLKVSAKDCRLSGLSIARNEDGTYRDLEIGLLFLERAYELVKDNGRIGIVLPETYFFSTNYRFVLEWIKTRLRVETVANIPMEAFQGFCRAKTNFYVFRKYPKGEVPEESVELLYSIPFLNPKTCGIYKDGKARFKIDAETGEKSKTDIDNELVEAVDQFVHKKSCPSRFDVPADLAFGKGVLVPTYFDTRYNRQMDEFLKVLGVRGVSLGELIDRKLISVRTGHGSPGNDQRTGTVPYIKVSDIRALRMNINPTNMIPRKVAEKFWRGQSSGLAAWDVLTPNRASSNIGEFAIVMPGEEDVVLTKEMFVLRVMDDSTIDPFYLLWALCLKAVRDQWRRIVLMQTNREDCGDRYREIILPMPPLKKWALDQSASFRKYFTTVAAAKTEFLQDVHKSGFSMIASVSGTSQSVDVEEEV